MSEDLLFLSASEAAARIRRGALSPIDYVEAVLSAIAERQPVLNAYAAVDAERARAAAREAAAAVRRGDTLGPLHGVPVNVKDLIDTAGLRTAHGSAIYADNVPARDNILVARLKAAGAIVVGKTTTPEFGHKGLTDGPSFGITRNPWHTGRTPGGSSGGAAAAVAAGLTPLGLGNDGAGSIRIPAACCGLVGLKPTLGAVPYEQTQDLFFNHAYAGPLARTVADAALMHGVLAGADRSDPWSLNAPAVATANPALIGNGLTGIRIGYIRRMANPELDGDVEANTLAALAALAGMGAEIEEVRQEVDWAEPEGRVMYWVGMHVYYGPYVEKWGDRMDKVLLAYIERGAKYGLAEFRNAQFARTSLYRSVESLLERYDFLVSPTLTRTALPVEFNPAEDEVEVNGRKCGITRVGWTAYVYPFNLSGHPAASVPSGWAADGLPTGLQIIGPWWSDVDLLRLAAAVERVRPWAERRPPLTSRP